MNYLCFICGAIALILAIQLGRIHTQLYSIDKHLKKFAVHTSFEWEELRRTIQELHENNQDKPDVENVTRFLLNLMNVIDTKCERKQ